MIDSGGGLKESPLELRGMTDHDGHPIISLREEEGDMVMVSSAALVASQHLQGS